MKINRFLRIEEDGIVFKTSVNHQGVQTVLRSTISRAMRILRLIGQDKDRVSHIEGTFSETTFVVDPPFTKEEIVIFEEKL